MAMLAILVLPLMYLGLTAVATVLPSAVASIANPGPHGFSEILYLFTSSTGNNGSAFGGITGNTPFYNTTGAVAMFVGRFFMIIPAMAIAGSLAAKKTVPASAGTFPTAWRTVRRPARRRDPDRRRPHLLPRARARPHRRAPRHDALGSCSKRAYRSHTNGNLAVAQAHAGHSSDRSQDRRARDRLGLRQARSALDDEEPGDVRGRSRRRAHHRHLHPRLGERRRASRLHLPDHCLAVVHRAVRQFRRSRGGGPRQGASGNACARPAKRPWPSSSSMRSTGLDRAHSGSQACARPDRAGRSWRPHPLRRRGDRRHRLGQRGGHHGRVRAGHSRVRRRPLGRHRRHAGRFRLAQGAYHRGARLDLPRPHDCPGRGRRAPEDAERDRAEHSARRHDHHLRLRHGDHPELCGLCRRARSRWSFSWRCS